MAQRKDVQPEWVITTFGTLVDSLKAATTSPDTSPIAPRSASSDPGPQVNIGILQRLGFVQTGKMLGDQLGWSEAWVPEPGRRLSLLTCATADVRVPRSWTAGPSIVCLKTNQRPLWAS